MDERKPSGGGGSSWVHEPLPYLVRLRSATDDDSAPRVTIHRVVAYSLLEAVMQAFYEADGCVSEAAYGKFAVEAAGPDVAAWQAMMIVGRALSATEGRP